MPNTVQVPKWLIPICVDIALHRIDKSLIAKISPVSEESREALSKKLESAQALTDNRLPRSKNLAYEHLETEIKKVISKIIASWSDDSIFKNLQSLQLRQAGQRRTRRQSAAPIRQRPTQRNTFHSVQYTANRMYKESIAINAINKTEFGETKNLTLPDAGGQVYIARSRTTHYDRAKDREVQYQEDRATIEKIHELTSDVNLRQLLSRTLLTLGQRYIKPEAANNVGHAGSTAVLAAADEKKVTIANLGDSAAFIIALNSDNHYACTRLSQKHNPRNPVESNRVKKEGGRIWNLPPHGHRLGTNSGTLGVTRSLGDIHAPGLSTIPALTEHTKENGMDYWVLSCSDGVSDFVNLKDIETWLNLYKLPMQNFAKFVCQMAFLAQERKRHYDNISATLMPAKPGYVAAVFDGHGGEFVAEDAVTKLPEVLKKCCTTQTADFVEMELPEYKPLEQTQGQSTDVAVESSKRKPTARSPLLTPETRTSTHRNSFHHHTPHNSSQNHGNDNDCCNIL